MTRITNTLASALRRHAYKATEAAYSAGQSGIANKSVAPSLYEAFHVAQLCASIHKMAFDWRQELSLAMPNVGLSLSSVFTHQRPYVKWPNRSSTDPRCELADLLLVVIDRTGSHAINHAVLVQAKLSEFGCEILKDTGEQRQFDLFSQRPVFDLVRKDCPSQVNLKQYSPDSALMYGLASKYSCNLAARPMKLPVAETWFAADDLGRVKNYEIDKSGYLAAVLVGLIQGSYGWPFELSPRGEHWKYYEDLKRRDDWSMLINFLLEDTFSKPINRALQATVGQQARGQDSPLFLVTGTNSMKPSFFVSSGFSQSSFTSQFEVSVTEGKDWVEGDLEGFFGGGGNWSRDANPEIDDSDGGPISSIVIELSRKD